MRNDQRAGNQVARLLASAGARILALSGNRVSATWTLPRLVWLCEHEPMCIGASAGSGPRKTGCAASLMKAMSRAPGLMLADASGESGQRRIAGLPALRLTTCRISQAPTRRKNYSTVHT